MSVRLKLHDSNSRVETAPQLRKNDTELSVEPFSPRNETRLDMEELHAEEANNNDSEGQEVSGVAGLGLWGLGIGILSMLFACKRFCVFRKTTHEAELNK